MQISLLLLLAIMTTLPSRGAPAPEPNPALLPVADVPGLPRILLLGDSISIGYTLRVRELLQGVANVHRAPMNCRSTRDGLAKLDEWLGAGRWDVIHFNFGLHDLKYADAQGKMVAPDQGKQVAPLEAYAGNLRAIVARLKKTGAKLVWCSTTPVPEGTQGRVAGAEREYNRVALAVMAENGVAVDDLGAFAAARLAEVQLPRNVHFTPSGYAKLAECVAASLRKELGK
jgi:acyl-CoA thioesterase-1